jgi:hypothetical protein
MRRGVLLVLFLSILTPVGAAPGIPHRVLHSRSGPATMGAPLRISVVLPDDPASKAQAVLFYRAQGQRRFAKINLLPRGGGRFEREIPPSALSSLSVSYYIEITDPAEQWQFVLGSPEQPFQADLTEPPVKTGLPAAVKVSFVSAPLFILAMTLWLFERRRRNEVLNQLFWLRNLVPLLNMRGPQLVEEVTRLSQEALEHPVHGCRRYQRNYVIKKLAEVRALDFEDFAKSCARYVGAEIEVPRKPLPVQPATWAHPQAPPDDPLASGVPARRISSKEH